MWHANFELIVEKLGMTLVANNSAIKEASVEKMVSKYANDCGYTDANKQIVQSINAEIQEMTISAFLENINAFIKMEPKLDLLYKYCQQRNVNYNRQKPIKIMDLIALFCAEPDEAKVKQIENEYTSFVKNLQVKNEKINMILERIGLVKHYLVEKEISISSYEIPSIRKQDSQRSYNSFEQQKTIDDSDMARIIQEYCIDEYKKVTKLLVCPFCKSMFKEAAQGAYNYRMAQEDDWD